MQDKPIEVAGKRADVSTVKSIFVTSLEFTEIAVIFGSDVVQELNYRHAAGRIASVFRVFEFYDEF